MSFFDYKKDRKGSSKKKLIAYNSIDERSPIKYEIECEKLINPAKIGHIMLGTSP